jgi:hypothetical protein
MDSLEGETSKEICKTIEQLKGAIAELEARLRRNTARPHQGSLKSIGIRVLVAAERIEHLLSTLEAEEKSPRLAS